MTPNHQCEELVSSSLALCGQASVDCGSEPTVPRVLNLKKISQNWVMMAPHRGRHYWKGSSVQRNFVIFDILIWAVYLCIFFLTLRVSSPVSFLIILATSCRGSRRVAWVGSRQGEEVGLSSVTSCLPPLLFRLSSSNFVRLCRTFSSLCRTVQWCTWDQSLKQESAVYNVTSALSCL